MAHISRYTDTTSNFRAVSRAPSAIVHFCWYLLVFKVRNFHFEGAGIPKRKHSIQSTHGAGKRAAFTRLAECLWTLYRMAHINKCVCGGIIMIIILQIIPRKVHKFLFPKAYPKTHLQQRVRMILVPSHSQCLWGRMKPGGGASDSRGIPGIEAETHKRVRISGYKLTQWRLLVGLAMENSWAASIWDSVSRESRGVCRTRHFGMATVLSLLAKSGFTIQPCHDY